MSSIDTALILISLTCIIFVMIYLSLKHKNIRPIIFGTIVLFIVILFLNQSFAFPQVLETKGSTNQTIVLILCYSSMIIGMIAHYFYHQGESGQTKFTFNLVSFLMPIFVSPIVFIPLLNIIDQPNYSGIFTKANLIIYFIGFQNGFFWKGLFQQQNSS